MANFVIKRGLKADLPVTLADGSMYFTTDTGEFFVDCYNSLNVLERRSVLAEKANKDGSGKVITTTYVTKAENNLKAPLASPAFTGTPTAPTAISGTNTTQLATTAFVQDAMSSAGLGDMLKSVYDQNGNGIVDNAEKVNGFTVGVNVPSDARFTDTIVDISGKVDNSRVLTDVPANAKFTDTIYTHPTTAGNKHIPTGGASGQILRYSASGTAVWGADNDTITTINGKTGAISKADITALGIPAQDTVVDISGKADKTYVDNKVKTDVPSGAKFTDTVYTHPASHPASIITQDTNNRFVSDSEKGVWNGKQDALGFTPVNTTDNRLSDARTPLTHTHAESEITNLVTDLVGKEPIISTKLTAFNKNYNTSTTNVKMDGTVSVGTQDLIARADHIHPKDTTKANLASPVFTGVPTAPTAVAGTNTTQIATTAFVATAVESSGGGSEIIISATQPAGQVAGGLWYEIIG